MIIEVGIRFSVLVSVAVGRRLVMGGTLELGTTSEVLLGGTGTTDV